MAETITPASATVAPNATQQFTTSVVSARWSVKTGVGSTDQTGLYSAGATAGTATIQAQNATFHSASANLATYNNDGSFSVGGSEGVQSHAWLMNPGDWVEFTIHANAGTIGVYGGAGWEVRYTAGSIFNKSSVNLGTATVGDVIRFTIITGNFYEARKNGVLFWTSAYTKTNFNATLGSNLHYSTSVEPVGTKIQHPSLLSSTSPYRRAEASITVSQGNTSVNENQTLAITESSLQSGRLSENQTIAFTENQFFATTVITNENIAVTENQLNSTGITENQALAITENQLNSIAITENQSLVIGEAFTGAGTTATNDILSFGENAEENRSIRQDETLAFIESVQNNAAFAQNETLVITESNSRSTDSFRDETINERLAVSENVTLASAFPHSEALQFVENQFFTTRFEQNETLLIVDGNQTLDSAPTVITVNQTLLFNENVSFNLQYIDTKEGVFALSTGRTQLALNSGRRRFFE